MINENTHGNRWTLFVLIGCISMFMAELFAGSSLIWFIDPWSLFITYPLYLGHLIFFLNLAIRTKRTSIPQLYLWGVLFGLYESWITKVLWFGYPGAEGPSIALVGGIAILEFITLVFFWHPILAFLMPIIIFESFTLSQDSELRIQQKIFLSHLNSLKSDNKKTSLLYIILMIIGAGILSNNSSFDVITVFIAGLGSIGLIFLFFKLSSRKNAPVFSIYTLSLKKKGMTLVIIYLIALYLLTFFFLLPERLPNDFLPYFIIIGFYVFIGIMLKISNPNEESLEDTVFTDISIRDFHNASFFFKLYLLFIGLTLLFCLIPTFGFYIAFGVFLGMFFFGIPFFIVMLIKVFRKKPDLNKN